VRATASAGVVGALRPIEVATPGGDIFLPPPRAVKTPVDLKETECVEESGMDSVFTRAL